MYNSPITVLLPVYNGEKYLRETLDSLLGQTFEDFEILAVDDGSTDRSGEILHSFRDSRLRVLVNEQNIGQTPTLNRGLELARGRLIARADQDDICLPDRLEKQVAFFEQHPEFAAVGSQVLEINLEGELMRKLRLPTDEAVIRLRIITENPMAHSAVMLSAKAVRALGGYETGYLFIADWELWSRMLDSGYRVTNLPDTLIKYRRYEESSTKRFFSEIRHNEIPRLIGRNLKQLAGISLSQEQVDLFYHTRYLPHKLVGDKVDQAVDLCQEIVRSLREIANTRPAEKELARLETFLNLHLASAARQAGKITLARRLYASMLRRGQRPLGALARYGATLLGDRFWKKLAESGKKG